MIASRIAAVFRENRVPCIALNLIVITLVGSYYQVPAIAAMWEAVGEFKLRWAYAFSLGSTIFAAALLPSLVQLLMGTLPVEGRWKRVALLSLFWGYRGMEIDLFYQVQGWLFGTGNDTATLIKKVAVDQFVMSPLWFVPTVLIAMRWVDMEPTEGKYLFGKTDRWIEWAVRQARLPIVGGPIVDFRRGCVPEWLYIWEHDYETLRELVYDHVQQIVTRYRRTVSRWSVCSGLHVNTNFKLSFEQIMDLTRLCVLVVKKLHPAAKIEVDIAQPWGEYLAQREQTRSPFLFADELIRSGLHLAGLDLELVMGVSPRT